ncbi:hypothetical protein BA896_021995 [Janthinobacterium lividum]|uniref:Uncharacterized protein n=1 Tax=Janthinobacterium lividum TaxID=29581 RepID=A0A1E8PKL9_9BURK|nr:hypothetical protein BA896_021995 [Janthinobacterium lividum]
MSEPFDNVLRAIKRLPSSLHDRLFTLACSVLLPISTSCKVCNMLRGMAIGLLLGAGFACLAIAPFIHHWWGC